MTACCLPACSARSSPRRSASVSAGELPRHAVAAPVHRAAMWRAARSGLGGELLVPGQRAPVPAADAVHALLAELRPQLEEFGDWDDVWPSWRRMPLPVARRPTASGPRSAGGVGLPTSSTWWWPRPRAARPRWTRLAAAATACARRRGFWPDQVVARYRRVAPPALLRSAAGPARARAPSRPPAWPHFSVDGHHRPFAIDLLPRIVPAARLGDARGRADPAGPRDRVVPAGRLRAERA